MMIIVPIVSDWPNLVDMSYPSYPCGDRPISAKKEMSLCLLTYFTYFTLLTLLTYLPEPKMNFQCECMP